LGDGIKNKVNSIPRKPVLPDIIITNVLNGNLMTCFLSNIFDLYCVGHNNYGQMGDGTRDTVTSPKKVAGISVKQVSFGWSSVSVLLTNGQVMAFGDDYYGQLGSNRVYKNSFDDKMSALPVLAYSGNAISVKCGVYHTCLLTIQGVVLCTGRDLSNLIGLRYTFTQIPGLPSNVVELESGGLHSCVLLSDARVICWGWNSFGQLGNGVFTKSNYLQTPLLVNFNAIKLFLGSGNTCVVSESGSTKCFGQDLYGQLGDGKTTNIAFPIDAFSTFKIDTLSLGYGTSCFWTISRQLYCVGYGVLGELGNGTVNSLVALKVNIPYPQPTLLPTLIKQPTKQPTKSPTKKPNIIPVGKYYDTETHAPNTFAFLLKNNGNRIELKYYLFMFIYIIL
jgi:alpha-tubulin suppressor-like RCC1 family protein